MAPLLLIKVLEIYSFFVRFIYDELVCIKNANISITRHRNGDISSPVSRVPLRFQLTACEAGTKPEKRGKSLLLKSPSGSADLDHTVKPKKQRPLRSYQSLNTLPTTTAPSTPLTSFLRFPPTLTLVSPPIPPFL